MMKLNNLICLIILAVLLSSCYAVRAYRFRKFQLKDLDKFSAVTVRKSDRPFHFFYSSDSGAEWKNYLDTSLKNSLTYGFLVIRNDSILYEKYFDQLDSTNV